MLACSATKVNILSKTTLLFLMEKRANWTDTFWFSLPSWLWSHVIRNGFCSCHVFANSLTTLGMNLLMFTTRNKFCRYNYNLVAAIKKSKRNTLSFREPAFLLVSYPECSFSIVSRLGKLSVDQEINLYDRRPMNSVKRPPKRKAGSEDRGTRSNIVQVRIHSIKKK